MAEQPNTFNPLGGIQQFGDFTIANPLMGNTFQQPGLQPLKERDIVPTIQGWADSYGLTGEQVQQLIQVALQGVSQSAIFDRVIQYAQSNNAQNYADEAQANSNKIYGSQIGRLGNLLTLPGAIRNDAEYGNQLAAAEQQVNASLSQNMEDLAASTSASGMRSGNLGAKVFEMRNQAAMSKAQVQAGLKSDIIQRKTGLEGEKLNFDTQIGGIRYGAKTPRLGVEEAMGTQAGLEQARRGESTRMFGTLVGIGQQAVDTGMNAMTSLTGMLKKR